MKSTKCYQKFDSKQSILHALLLYSSSLSNVGLLRGKTGIAFFFMHYFRKTGEILYEDVACELLEEVTEELHKELPVTFESGLAGIGWAVNYLIAKEFVEGDSLDICEEIDRRIMEIAPGRLTDYSLEEGIGGILLYVLAHSKVVFDQQKKLPFDSFYLHSLYVACRNIHSCSTSVEITKLLDTYLVFYEDKKLPDESIWDVSVAVRGIPDFEEKKLSDYPLGIKGGLTGILFEEYCLCANNLLS